MADSRMAQTRRTGKERAGDRCFDSSKNISGISFFDRRVNGAGNLLFSHPEETISW